MPSWFVLLPSVLPQTAMCTQSGRAGGAGGGVGGVPLPADDGGDGGGRAAAPGRGGPVRGQKTGSSRRASGSTGFGGGLRGHWKTAWPHPVPPPTQANPTAAIADSDFPPDDQPDEVHARKAESAEQSHDPHHGASMTDVAVRFKIEGDSRSARRSADEAGGAFGGSVLQYMAHGALDIIDFAPW